MDTQDIKQKIRRMWINGMYPAKHESLFSLTPHQSDMYSYEEALKKCFGKDVLILGSTPSLRDLGARYGKRVTIVDESSLMMVSTSALLQYANPNDERWVHSDWLRLPLFPQSFDVVIADIIWWFFLNEEQKLLRDVITKCLRSGGSFISRFYIRRVHGLETPSGILQRSVERAIQNPDNRAEIYHATLLHLVDIMSEILHTTMERTKVSDFLLSKYKDLPQTQAAYLSNMVGKWVNEPNYTLQSHSQIVECFQPIFSLQSETYADDYSGSEALPVLSWKRRMDSSLSTLDKNRS